jgi:hypothetical protein
MSRVERTTDTNREPAPSRRADPGRRENEPQKPTPSKAEGELGDVEQALKKQKE